MPPTSAARTLHDRPLGLLHALRARPLPLAWRSTARAQHRVPCRQDAAANARVLCRCSFLEIYNEAIADLLAPGAAPLAVREDLRRGVYVEGLSEEVVACGARLPRGRQLCQG